MKVKTSITLSEDLLAELDRVAGGESRSALIEAVLRRYLKGRERETEEDREVERLNAIADRCGPELLELLEFQDSWPFDDEER